MRFLHLLKGDMKFQFQYGIYFIYAIILIVYGVAIHMVPEAWKYRLGLILVYSDPAALGMFFMGALILLEKSESALNSIAISPVTVDEYILSKLGSLGLISTLVAEIIALQCELGNYIWLGISVFFASCLFSLLGLLVGSLISGLNQFVIATVPCELLFLLPPIVYLFITPQKWMGMHPGIASVEVVMQGIGGVANLWILLLWVISLYVVTRSFVKNMFTRLAI